MKKYLIASLYYLATILLGVMYCYHITLYVLFSNLPFVGLSNDEFEHVIIINIIMLSMILVRVLISFLGIKRNGLIFLGILIIFLICLAGNFFTALTFIQKYGVKSDYSIQYVFLFVLPYLYLFLSIALIIINRKFFRKSINI